MSGWKGFRWHAIYQPLQGFERLKHKPAMTTDAEGRRRRRRKRRKGTNDIATKYRAYIYTYYSYTVYIHEAGEYSSYAYIICVCVCEREWKCWWVLILPPGFCLSFFTARSLSHSMCIHRYVYIYIYICVWIFIRHSSGLRVSLNISSSCT